MKNNKWCPLMSKPVATKDDGDVARVGVELVECAEERCAFWVTSWTTEGPTAGSSGQVSGCAVAIIAMGHKVIV
jgi:hypothetical protein